MFGSVVSSVAEPDCCSTKLHRIHAAQSSGKGTREEVQDGRASHMERTRGRQPALPWQRTCNSK